MQSTQARKIQGLNMGWNGRRLARLGVSIWVWTGNEMSERVCSWSGVGLK